MNRANLFHERTTRQRIDALADAGSFHEFLPPPERVMSPYLPQLDIPVSFDDGIVIGRALVWKTSGGKTKYLLNDAGFLTHDTAASIAEVVKTLLNKSSAVSLENLKARQQELSDRLKTFAKTGAFTRPH